MAKVLLIDDEPIYYKMILHALKPLGYEVEYAQTGLDGLKAVPVFQPDVVITDLRLPDLSGYEVARRLRRDPRYKNLPLIFLTSQAELSNKLKAFEAGADDYLSKPFQPEELVARVGMLVRRGETLRAASSGELHDEAEVIAVHSLRGGAGTSSMAVNLGMMFYRMWGKPTLLIDSVLNAGQVAMMLNGKPRHTWEDLTDVQPDQVDSNLIEGLVSHHPSGIDYIAAPSYPVALDLFPDEVWKVVLDGLRCQYEFIVIDTAHDFNNGTIHMLNSANQILLMLLPEMASIRAAVCALDIYDRLNYPPEKILPVLNNVAPSTGIKQAQVEKVLKRQIRFQAPNAPADFLRAINFGEPLVETRPESVAAAFFEDVAYALSKPALKDFPPAAPTTAWKRATGRVSKK